MIPTTLDNLRDVLLQWCFDITGRVLVLANSGQGPKPSEPYVEVFLSSYDTPTFQVAKLSGDGLTETVTSNTLMSVQLDLYGNNPMQDASKLMRSLFSSQRFLDLWQISGLSGVDTVSDLTAIETGAMKQRANLIFRVYCLLEDTFSSDFSETVPISVNIPEKNYTEIVPGGEDPGKKAPICFT